MAFNLAMPRPESKLVGPDGSISRDWYLFIAALLQAVGGPSVVPGGGIAPIDNQMQFEEYAISVPDAVNALRSIDELRNEISTRGNGQQALRTAYDELISALDGLRNISDFRNRIDDIEALIDALRPNSLPLIPEQFIAPVLINSWVNYGAPWNPVGYCKDPFGIVHLRGMAKSGVMGTSIFTLPGGYRPANQEIVSVASNGALGIAVIDATGNVGTNTGNNAYFSIDGITFRAA